MINKWNDTVFNHSERIVGEPYLRRKRRG